MVLRAPWRRVTGRNGDADAAGGGGIPLLAAQRRCALAAVLCHIA